MQACSFEYPFRCLDMYFCFPILSENSKSKLPKSSPKALQKQALRILSESRLSSRRSLNICQPGDGDSEYDNVHENQVDGDEEGEVVKQDRRFIEGGLISNNLVGITSTGIYAAFLQKCKTLILPNNRNLDRANIWEHKSQAAAALQ